MKNRTHLTVSRKNALTWLMALCLVGSAVTRIAFAGLKGSGSDFSVWSQIVLPVAATLLFVLITLVNGKEMFYKTAIPVWLLGLYYALEPHAVLGDSPFVMGMFYTCIIFYCALYTAITSGKIRYPWLLVPLVLVALGAVGYSHQYLYVRTLVISWTGAPSAYQFVLADYLLFGGILLLTLAIRVSPAGEYHPTWGDRSDGRKVRTLAPMLRSPPISRSSGTPAPTCLKSPSRSPTSTVTSARSAVKALPISASPMCCWLLMSVVWPVIPSSTGSSPARRFTPAMRTSSTAWSSRKK